MLNKIHKYSIKIFKLCCDYKYIYSFRIYTRKALDKENIILSNIIMICVKILCMFHKGHELCTDILM